MISTCAGEPDRSEQGNARKQAERADEADDGPGTTGRAGNRANADDCSVLPLELMVLELMVLELMVLEPDRHPRPA